MIICNCSFYGPHYFLHLSNLKFRYTEDRMLFLRLADPGVGSGRHRSDLWPR